MREGQGGPGRAREGQGGEGVREGQGGEGVSRISGVSDRLANYNQSD